MIEIQSSDKLSFDNKEDCVEYILEMPPIFPIKNHLTQNMHGKVNSSTNSSYKKYHKKHRLLNYYKFSEENQKDVEQEPIFLPIVGVKFFNFF